jgi:hypothetical protein
VSLAGVWACSSAPPVIPSPTVTLSGLVSERTSTGLVPLAWASILTDDGHWSAQTDDEGRYSISGFRATPKSIGVTASKSGYVMAISRGVISGDTRIDFELDRRQTYTLSGVISEMTSSGPAGIKGVVVAFCNYVSEDDYACGDITTDEQGRYSLAGLWGPDVSTVIRLTKEGFRIGHENFCGGCFRILTITGDTELNIQLEPS